jgi:nucleoside-diphosphate-sugar epimerase
MRLDDGRVFADFVADVVNGRDIVMKSDGSALRAFCYLSDATVGFFKVLLYGMNREAYNVGNDKGEISILQLANILAGLSPAWGLKVIRQETSPGGGYLRSRINRACPDISKMRGLGWEPRYTVEEGFARTVKSFLQ